MDNTYTSGLESEIWRIAKELDEIENEDFSLTISFLNSEDMLFFNI